MDRFRISPMFILCLVVYGTACGPSSSTQLSATASSPTEAIPQPSSTLPHITASSTEMESAHTENPEYPLATSIEDILGVWRGLMTHGLINQFNADGTNLVATSQSKLPDHPDAIQQITFDGTNLIMVEIEVTGLSSCDKNAGIYQVQLVKSDMIQFIAIKDPCRLRKSSTEGMHKKIK